MKSEHINVKYENGSFGSTSECEANGETLSEKWLK